MSEETKQIDDMTREELLEIVRKLPVTADGVPILPGMFLYRADHGYAVAVGHIGQNAPCRMSDGSYEVVGDLFSSHANSALAKATNPEQAKT